MSTIRSVIASAVIASGIVFTLGHIFIWAVNR